jgi:hypothetical protein
MWIEPVVRACKVDDAIIDDDVDDLQSVTCSGESGSGSGDGHGESNNPNGDEGDKQPGGVGEGTGEGSGGSGSSVAAATTPAVAATTTTGGEEGDACAGEEGKKQQKQQRRSKLWCTVAHNQYFLLQKRRKRKMAPPVPPSSSTNSFSSTFQPVTKSNNNKEQQLQQQHQVAERSRSVPGSAPGSMPTSAKGSPLKLATTPPSSSSSTLASMSMLNRNRAQTERTNNNDFKSKSAAFPIPRGRSDADAYLTARQEEREQALGHKRKFHVPYYILLFITLWCILKLFSEGTVRARGSAGRRVPHPVDEADHRDHRGRLRVRTQTRELGRFRDGTSQQVAQTRSFVSRTPNRSHRTVFSISFCIFFGCFVTRSTELRTKRFARIGSSSTTFGFLAVAVSGFPVDVDVDGQVAADFAERIQKQRIGASASDGNEPQLQQPFQHVQPAIEPGRDSAAVGAASVAHAGRIGDRGDEDGTSRFG